jgi:hypothetical protein
MRAPSIARLQRMRGTGRALTEAEQLFAFAIACRAKPSFAYRAAFDTAGMSSQKISGAARRLLEDGDVWHAVQLSMLNYLKTDTKSTSTITKLL